MNSCAPNWRPPPLPVLIARRRPRRVPAHAERGAEAPPAAIHVRSLSTRERKVSVWAVIHWARPSSQTATLRYRNSLRYIRPHTNQPGKLKKKKKKRNNQLKNILVGGLALLFLLRLSHGGRREESRRRRPMRWFREANPRHSPSEPAAHPKQPPIRTPRERAARPELSGTTGSVRERDLTPISPLLSGCFLAVPFRRALPRRFFPAAYSPLLSRSLLFFTGFLKKQEHPLFPSSYFLSTTCWNAKN